MEALGKAQPALVSRINKTFSLLALTDEEAGLLLAKKLLAKRLVEELEPLFPFEKDAVALLNRAVGGNPRRLLEIADRVLEYAVEHRAYRIDTDVVDTVPAMREAAQAINAVATPPTRPLAPAPAETHDLAETPDLRLPRPRPLQAAIRGRSSDHFAGASSFMTARLIACSAMSAA